jgi:hypothetical protein
MTYDENSPKRAMREIWAASNSLRQTLLQVREQYPNLPNISIRVNESTEDQSSASPPSVSRRLIITIEAESQAHAEEHAAPLQDQGCICTSTGPTSVECDCSDVPE